MSALGTTIPDTRKDAISEATHLVDIALNELRAAINGQGQPAAAFWRLVDAAGLLATSHSSAMWAGLYDPTGRGFSLRIERPRK